MSLKHPMEGASALPEPPTQSSRSSWRTRIVVTLCAALLAYFVIAYVLLPLDWMGYSRRHPNLEDNPRVTHTKTGIPADPLNVALVGTKAEVQAILKAAGWYPADPLGLRSDLKIAEATVLRRPDDKAPVSSLYLFDRKEDLAFEQPVGHDPRRRHHVRFWHAETVDADGQPVWVGAATFDARVGFSHTTGEITHHVAPDIDAERDHVFDTLKQTGNLAEVYVEHGFHKTLTGRNGGGDPWHTDGNLVVGLIATHGSVQEQ